jgi:uncharacterized protein (TIGR02996 family)
MTDGDLLYEAILANPLDYTPRAMYADWLDENDVTKIECDRCKRPSDAKNHVTGHIFVGRGRGWQPCSKCGGSTRITSIDNRIRAEFIREQMADPNLNVNPWIRYFKTWFAPLLEGHGSYAFNENGFGKVDYDVWHTTVIVKNGFVDELWCSWQWFTRPANASKMFTQPVGKVKIVDSGYINFGSGPGFGTIIRGQIFGESNFPATLRRALGSDPRLERLYGTKAEADAALSDVCVDWGRKQWYLASRKEVASA